MITNPSWSALRRALKSVSGVLHWPAVCILCGQACRGIDVCPACRGDLPRLGPCCPRCAEPAADCSQPCPRCDLQPPSFDVILTSWHYRFPLSALVVAFKFKGNLTAGKVLADLWCEELAALSPPLPDALLPCPLHPTRLAERGFNQCALLARQLARQTGVPMLPDLIQRVRATEAQSSLDLAARQSNLTDAFALGRRPASGMPRHVAIIDDVVTSGATANCVAQALKQAGVDRVSVWALARAGFTD